MIKEFQTLKNPEYDFLLKILMIGNSGVGKSCILMRFSVPINQILNNQFKGKSIHQPFLQHYWCRLCNTQLNFIQLNFFQKIKHIKVDNKKIKLQIWDTAGQDRFKTIASSYYRGANGVMIVFDITDKNSFENVRNWMSEIEKYILQKEQNALNRYTEIHVDIPNQRQVSTQEAEYFAKSHNLTYIETSAKSDHNIQLAFNLITQSQKKNGFYNLKQRPPQKNGTQLVQKQIQQKEVKTEKKQDRYRACC